MLHLIPAPLHRAGLRLAHGVRRRWWRWRRPSLSGCRVLAVDSAGRVLLVRHSYGTDHWMPPGGGLRRGEDPVVSAARELVEETGCVLTGARVVDIVADTLHGAGNRVHIVLGRCDEVPHADGREVVAARFFAPDALPDNMAAKLRESLPVWLTAGTIAP